MAFTYTIKDQFGLYFVTFTVHQWADVFSRRDYADIVIGSLKFCQKEKGLHMLFDMFRRACRTHQNPVMAGCVKKAGGCLLPASVKHFGR